MRLLIDTNVILDYLLSRGGFREQAKELFDLVKYGEHFEVLSSSAVTDIFTISTRSCAIPFKRKTRFGN